MKSNLNPIFLFEMNAAMAKTILGGGSKYSAQMQQQAKNFFAGQAKGHAMGMAKKVVSQGNQLRQSASKVMLNGGDRSLKGIQTANALAQRGQQLQQQSKMWKQQAKNASKEIHKVNRGMQFDANGKLKEPEHLFTNQRLLLNNNLQKVQQFRAQRQLALNNSMSPINSTIKNTNNSTKTTTEKIGRNLKADSLKTKRLWGKNATGWRKGVKYGVGGTAALAVGVPVAGAAYLANDK